MSQRYPAPSSNLIRGLMLSPRGPRPEPCPRSAQRGERYEGPLDERAHTTGARGVRSDTEARAHFPHLRHWKRR
jgi:hypothetical protein